MSCPVWIISTIFLQFHISTWYEEWCGEVDNISPSMDIKRRSRKRYRETKTQEISRQPLFSKCHFFIISSTCVCSKSFNKMKRTSHAEKYIKGEFWIVQPLQPLHFLNYFFNIYFVIVMKYQQNILKVRLIVAYNKKQCCDCPKSWAQGLLVPG